MKVRHPMDLRHPVPAPGKINLVKRQQRAGILIHGSLLIER